MLHKVKTRVLFAACFFLLMFSFVHKAEPHDPNFSAEAVYEFASKNYETGDYLAAAIEFKRFVHFFPEHHRAAEAGYKAGMSYFRIPRYGDAINAFKRVTEQFDKSDFVVQALFMVSRCHVKLNNIKEAIHTLDIIASQAEDHNDRDRAFYNIGRLSLGSGEISRAKAAFNKMAPENREKFQIDGILKDLADPDSIPSKSPVLAGLFSIIPGGGYLYCGRYREAATAFFLTSGLAVASWEAFDKDLHAIGGLAGLAGAGFYGGGLIGAVSSAHKYNRKSYRNYVRQLPETSPESSLSFGIGPNSVRVLFSWHF
ncbi:MAG: tetratricopeptide repeat protein [Desulfobacteraceae bacterium]|nr:tetratricopeptide repeat protein [Desulfobacteraceae bacterium]MCF8094903.1 tetratricopeptide repeat protein [Desulfobacteraceae bacterium]